MTADILLTWQNTRNRTQTAGSLDPMASTFEKCASRISSMSQIISEMLRISFFDNGFGGALINKLVPNLSRYSCTLFTLSSRIERAHRDFDISVERNTMTAANSNAAPPKPSAAPIATPIAALPNEIPTISPSNSPMGSAGNCPSG